MTLELNATSAQVLLDALYEQALIECDRHDTIGKRLVERKRNGEPTELTHAEYRAVGNRIQEIDKLINEIKEAI